MRYFLALLAFLVFMVLVVVIIFHHGPKNASSPGSIRSIVLTDYVNKNSEVRMTVDGQINALENHRSEQISVTPTSRRMTIYQGYNGSILKEENLSNTTSAYESFVYGLNNLGFIKERKGVNADERGACPLGQRISFELIEDGKPLTHLWTTSCSTKLGNFAGNSSSTQTLFQRQIPDYNQMISGVTL